MPIGTRNVRRCVVAALATLTWACGGKGPSLPTSPSAATPQSYTLSGFVSEMTPDGPRPVEGVRIEGDNCEIGSCRGQSATSGEDGLYSLSLYAGQNGLYVTKAGYIFDGAILPDCDNCIALITLKSDTRFDFRLVRR